MALPPTEIGTAMRSRATTLSALVGVASILALVLGFAPVAQAANPAYKVSLNLSKSTSQAGKFLIASGTVVGPKAAGKTVTIQRRYVGGSWTTVAVATIKSTGRYSALVETPRGGTTSFRVLKPRSSVRSAGVSPVRALKVYEWLYLANQGVVVQSGSSTQPIDWTFGGVRYERSIIQASNFKLTYKLKGAGCTTFTTRAGYDVYGTDSGPDTITFSVDQTQLDGGPNSTTSVPLTSGQSTTVNASTANTWFLNLEVTGQSNGYIAELGNPRVYCNADHLPSIVLSEVS